LWVIGANGRIDILTRNLSFNIINTNKNPKEASWYIVSGNKKPLPFTKEQFFSMIGSHEGA
jgi:hypothetical protein